MRLLDALDHKFGTSVLVVFHSDPTTPFPYVKDVVDVLPTDRLGVIDWSFLKGKCVQCLAFPDGNKNFSIGSTGDSRMQSCVDQIKAALPLFVVFSAYGHEGTVKGYAKRYRRIPGGGGTYE